MHTVYDIHHAFVFGIIAMIVETNGDPNEGNPRMIRNIRSRFRGLTTRNDGDAVHFHQGPQHQPVPCFDTHCDSPRLSV
jgi:hypothetical protein